MKNSRKRTVRTTVDLPVELVRQIDTALERGVARNRNALLTRALGHYLSQLEPEAVDAAFEQMAHDPDYAAIVRETEREWSSASDEAWRLIDAAERRSAQSATRKPTRRPSHAAR